MYTYTGGDNAMEGKESRFTVSLRLDMMTIILVCFVILTGFLAVDAKNLPDKDIVILHTNDVHCGGDDNIGYAGLA